MTSGPNILFIADAGARVGGGHVMRSLTLAKALEAKGAACAFAATPAVRDLLQTFGPPEGGMIGIDDAAPDYLVGAALAAAAAFAPGIVVLDHYRLRRETYAPALRAAGCAVVVIDDLGDRAQDCDLLVDPTLGRTAEAYAKLVPIRARVLTGPDYALLRPQFAQARALGLSRRDSRGAPERALVALGLTDVGGITGRVVQTLLQRLDGTKLDVVVGDGAPSLAALAELAGDDERVRLHVDRRDMAGLMSAADFAIGAGGSSVWERACLGLPSVCLVLADNQRPLALELDRRGATLAIDVEAADFDEALAAAWRRLLTEGSLRASLAQESAALCDGLGAERSAEAALALAR